VPVDEDVAARALASLPGVAVLVFDRDLHCVLAAGDELRRHGWEADLIVGRGAADVLPASVAAEVRAALDGSAATRAEPRLADADAGYEFRCVPVCGPDGDIVEAVATFAAQPPIARASRADTALVPPTSAHRTAFPCTIEQLEGTFEQAPIGMALVGVDGRWLRVNRSLCEMTGYSQAELLAMTFRDLMHPDDLDADLGLVGELVVGNRRCYATEKRYFRKDGEQGWMNLAVALVRDAGGAPEYFISQFEDVSERKRSEERLVSLAEHDPLTGLLNRRRFERDLEQRVERCHRYGEQAAVMMIDLDNFKYVNDAFGHSAGDQLLKEAARALRDGARDGDHVARLGGDEFAIIAEHATPAAALELANRLVAAIRRHPVAIGEKTVRTTASIGVVPIDGAAPSAETVLIAADAAMYDAKAAGRNRAALGSHDAADYSGASAGVRWSEILRRALDRGELVLFTQPLVPVTGGGAPWHEVLLRLRRDGGELAEPAAFLYHAERFGLMSEIDRWVIRESCRLLGSGAFGRAGLSINVSAQSLADDDLVGYVQSELAAAGVCGERLMFELTETEALRDLGHAQRAASGLQRLGCRVALDDFATGFGSLSYIKSLPFDVLKIDGEFIRNLTTNKTDQLIVHAVVDLARGLGKHTVAEFVTDRATLELVRELGVDFAQGFHVGRPRPAPSAGLGGGARRNAAAT
jgi:diguanylate cyclase (GGDEF)-like protein/PAS domain S-box-containing protein